MDALTQFSGMMRQQPASGRGLLDSDACAALDALAVRASAKVAVEVGSYYGLGSTPVLSRAMGADGLLVCVDNWPEVAVFSGFMSNIHRMGMLSRIVPLRVWSETAAKMFKPGTFDLAFIDGGHSHACVQSDIRFWLPLVRPGGIICGDDYDRKDCGVAAAVDEAFPGCEVHARRLWAHQVGDSR